VSVLSFDIQAFEELMTNPTKIAIWTEIFRKPGITAKDLIQRLQYKKTKMYYNLGAMLDKGLIDAEIVPVKQTLSLKKYRISKGFEQLLRNPEVLLEKPKEFKLFSLFTIIALLQYEITKTLNITNEELKSELEDLRAKNLLPTGVNVLFYSMDREQKLISEFREFMEAKIAKNMQTSIDSETFKKNYGSFIFGFLGSD
jgi:hypothetical protein